MPSHAFRPLDFGGRAFIHHKGRTFMKNKLCKFRRIAHVFIVFGLTAAVALAEKPVKVNPNDPNMGTTRYFGCRADEATCEQEGDIIAAGAIDQVDLGNWNWQTDFPDGTMIVGGWMFD
jgi:hypothetical protein